MSAILSRSYLKSAAMRSYVGKMPLDVAMTVLIVVVLAGGIASYIHSLRPTASLATKTLLVPPEVAPPPQDPARAILTPAMQAALDHVVQRYQLSADALQPVFEVVQTVGHERKLDPMLLIAIISIESGFNAFSQSPMGAQGLMQIIPRYHQDKLPSGAGEASFLDPVINVKIGAQILQEAIRRHGGLMAGLQFYAGALNDDEQGYANKVLAEKLRLDRASRRREGAPS